jgi:site-specific DNA recombinase
VKQSNSKTNRDKTIALYLRISREDQGKDESYSIINQRKLLQKAAKEKGFTKLIEFVDDGITGTKKDRKDFVRMLAELEKGSIGAVMVKDLSRLARDHIRADSLLEEFFPEHDIRFLSVSEGIDTAQGEDEFAPFRNLMNEWYARDISKKRKLTNIVKGNAGEPLSLPPYGYQKDPDNPKRWIVDEEAAAVVRRVFQMTLDGFGTEQIAAALSEDKILTPMFYWRSKGINRPGKVSDREPYRWNSSTVVKILSMQEYCGDVINFKTFSKSFKLKKRIPNAEENRAVFKDVHEPIIARADWEKIQQKRGKARKRKTSDGEKNMFSGLLVCADCGHNLWYHFNQKNPEIRYFSCSNYKGNRGDCPTTHYIRVDFLEQVLLQEIRRLTKFASRYEKDFARLVMEHSQQADLSQRQRKQKELDSLLARDRELDTLFNRMYEDNIAGKIDDERFARMSRQYTLEQQELAEKTKELRAELDKAEDKAMTAELFIATVRKYTRAKKLTERMLNELIERIEVHQAEKVDGVQVQRLTIHYNCVGTIEVPDILPLPQPEIVIQTRKGVAVSYSPSQSVVNF